MRVSPNLEPVANPVFLPDQRNLIDQRVRHRRLGVLASPGEEVVLNVGRYRLVTEALGHVVVVMLRARAHVAA